MNIKRNAIIINLDDFRIGGIQTNFARIIKALGNTENNIDFYWYTKSPELIDNEFKQILKSVKAKTVLTHKKIWWFKFEKIDYREYDKIVIISFNLYDYVRNEKICKKVEKNKVNNILFIPHYKGKDSFLEYEYNGIMRKYIHSRVKKIYEELYDFKSLFFFAPKQAETVSEIYSLDIKNIKDVLLKGPNDIPKYNRENTIRKYNRNSFNIIAVTRMDFPHKGYVIGLIDSFCELLEIHTNLYLTIVGYGPNEDILLEKINKLPCRIKGKVNYVGKLEPSELEKYMQDADLNISLAGCVGIGAINGVISLPVRHYTYACETYGFLPESKGKTVCEEPGDSIEKYIEAVLNFNEEEYEKYTLASYRTYADEREKNSDTEFLLKINTLHCPLSKVDKLIVMFTNYYAKIKHIFQISKKNDEY